MTKRRRESATAWRVVALALSLVVLLTACGAEGAKTLPPDTPRLGGTLWQGSVKLGSEDPAKARTVSERVIASELYATLTTWDPNTLEAIPALAASWEVTPDAKQFTFRLRNDIKAENGDPVTASDVRQSLLVIAHKDSGSPLREHLVWLTGFDEYQNGAPSVALPSIVVVDAQTIQIGFDHPFADFPLLLGNPGMGISHFGKDQNGEDKRFTTGPFRVESRSEDGWRLVRSEGSKAYLDAINVRFFENVNASYEAFTRGDVDWSAIPLQRTKEAEKSYGAHLFNQSLRALYLSFNTQNPKASDVKMRQGLARAFDKPQLVAALDALAEPMNGFVPSGTPQDNSSGCGSACIGDLNVAKQLIGTSAPTFVFEVSKASPIGDRARELLIKEAAAAGATLVPQSIESTDFIPHTVANDRELIEMGWSGAYPSPGAFLDPLFRSTSQANISAFKNAEVDRALDEASAALDKGGRLRAYQRAEALIVAQMPAIPLASFPVDSVAQVGIRGIAVLPTGNFDASRVWKTNTRASE